MSSDPTTGRPAAWRLAIGSGLAGALAGALAMAGYMRSSGDALPAAPNPSQAAVATSPHPVSAQGIAEMTDKLARRLAAQPDDADGWAMLARSYAVGGRHTEALEPFAKAVALRPDDPTLLADYADSLAMTRQRSLEGEPAALVERALAVDANHPKALSLAGTAAFDRGDYARAIELWQRLREVAPPGSPLTESVQAGIDEARQLAATQASASGIRLFAPRPARPASQAGFAASTGGLAGAR